MAKEFISHYGIIAKNNSTISGSLIVTNGITGSFTGSLVGSLTGTASYASQTLSSSFSSTSSYVNTLNQDLTFNGNLTLNGTASITFLNVAYESSSIIYSSGSNQFGDATNDVQLLIGTTKVSGSFEVTGSANVTTSLTTPLIIGGSSTTQTLTYKTTTGIGTTDAHIFQVGNNGATEAMRILNSGNVGIGTTSPVSLVSISNTPVGGTTGGNPTFTFLDTRNLNAAAWLANTTPLGTIQAYTTDLSTTPNPIGAITFIAPQLAGSSPACDISFSTGNTSTFTERMRILSTGNVGIGTATPTAVLQLKAGTATASTAPIKLTSGTLLTVAEVGAIEFLTDAYYATITTGTARKTFAFLDNPFIVNKTINVTFNGQEVVIPINTNVIIPATGNGGTITNWYIEGNLSGSIVIDILKNGVSMSGTGNKPTLSSAITANAAVSGWTSVVFATNDKLEIKVTTASTTLTTAYLVFKYTLT